MISMAGLVRWEWFKLRRRWMPWILLVILLLFSQLAVWGSFFAYRGQESSGGQVRFGGLGTGQPFNSVDCNDLLAGYVPDSLSPDAETGVLAGLRQECEQMAAQQPARLQAMSASFTLPDSVLGALSMAQAIGLILVVILTTSVLGTEYGWGTIRLVLARGTGRWQFLASKLVVLGLVSLGALVLVEVAVIVSSLLAGALSGTGDPASLGLGYMADLAEDVGRTWFSLWPYMALAGFFTVLTRSTAAGMAISLAYYFGEQIAVAIFINLFDWFQTVADYLLTRNISAWMLGLQPETGRHVGFVMGGSIGELPGEMHAFLLLVVYTLVLGALAFWRFQGRDIPGANGG